MNEPRPKWRISIRAALGTTLGLGSGVGMVGVGFAVGPWEYIVIGIIVISITIGMLGSMVAGRNPAEGLIWGLLGLVIGFWVYVFVGGMLVGF